MPDGGYEETVARRVHAEHREKGMQRRIKELEAEVERLKRELAECKAVRGW